MNLGLGPAVSVNVTWIPKEIRTDQGRFELGSARRQEPVFSESLNEMPAVPTHIAPNQEAALPYLPAFIDKDIEKKITRVYGELEIKCVDVFGVQHVFRQEYRLFTGYKERPPWVEVTFSRTIHGD